MMTIASEEIISYLRGNKEMLHERFGVTRIGIFGGFARGEQTPASDIDTVVGMEEGKKNLHSFLELRRFLENEMARKIDLGFEHSIKLATKEKVLRQFLYV